MTCRSCGATIADKAIVCYRCGTATADPATLVPKRPAPPRPPLALLLVAPVLLALAAWWAPIWSSEARMGWWPWVVWGVAVLGSAAIARVVLRRR
jgi:hypothetical protein